MSTEKNKAALRRVYDEIFNKGKLSVVDEVIAANYILHGVATIEVNGPEGFKQFVTMYRNAFPDLQATVVDMVAEGDKVAHSFTLRGTHKGALMGIAPTGKQVTLTGTTISRFAGGKEIEARMNADVLGLYQQLGVIPPIGPSGK